MGSEVSKIILGKFRIFLKFFGFFWQFHLSYDTLAYHWHTEMVQKWWKLLILESKILKISKIAIFCSLWWVQESQKLFWEVSDIFEIFRIFWQFHLSYDTLAYHWHTEMPKKWSKMQIWDSKIDEIIENRDIWWFMLGLGIPKCVLQECRIFLKIWQTGLAFSPLLGHFR